MPAVEGHDGPSGGQRGRVPRWQLGLSGRGHDRAAGAALALEEEASIPLGRHSQLEHRAVGPVVGDARARFDRPPDHAVLRQGHAAGRGRPLRIEHRRRDEGVGEARVRQRTAGHDRLRRPDHGELADHVLRPLLLVQPERVDADLQTGDHARHRSRGPIGPQRPRHVMSVQRESSALNRRGRGARDVDLDRVAGRHEVGDGGIHAADRVEGIGPRLGSPPCSEHDRHENPQRHRLGR